MLDETVYKYSSIKSIVRSCGVNAMKSKVSIVRNTDAKRRTLEAVTLIGGVEKVVGRGDRVLIKPNMVSGFPPETGETTDPKVVKTLVELVLAAGAREVSVGEGEPVVPPEVLRKRFIDKPLGSISKPLHQWYESEITEAGGKMLDFDTDRWEEVNVPDPVFFKSVRVARALLDCDFFIGVPALKTHHLTGITVALKNLYGAIPPEDKHQYHRMDRVEEAMVDINQIRSSDLVVVDGTYTILHWGMIDQHLETVRLDLALAGFDPVAVDAVSSRILGINPRTLRFLSWAEEKGLGTADLDNIETVGATIDEAYRGDMMTSVDYVNRKMNHTRLVNCGACTGCFGRIATVLFRADDREIEEDILVVMGPYARSIEKRGPVFPCGNCAAPTFYNGLKGTFIPGCPPDLNPLLENLRKSNVKV